MEKTKLNVFGRDITIQKKAMVVTVTKDESVEEAYKNKIVLITYLNQDQSSLLKPVNVFEKYGKTADEFIHEFAVQNSIANS